MYVCVTPCACFTRPALTPPACAEPWLAQQGTRRVKAASLLQGSFPGLRRSRCSSFWPGLPPLSSGSVSLFLPCSLPPTHSQNHLHTWQVLPGHSAAENLCGFPSLWGWIRTPPRAGPAQPPSPCSPPPPLHHILPPHRKLVPPGLCLCRALLQHPPSPPRGLLLGPPAPP